MVLVPKMTPDMDQNEEFFGTSDFVFFYKSNKRNHDLATDGGLDLA